MEPMEKSGIGFNDHVVWKLIPCKWGRRALFSVFPFFLGHQCSVHTSDLEQKKVMSYGSLLWIGSASAPKAAPASRGHRGGVGVTGWGTGSRGSEGRTRGEGWGQGAPCPPLRGGGRRGFGLPGWLPVCSQDSPPPLFATLGQLFEHFSAREKVSTNILVSVS